MFSFLRDIEALINRWMALYRIQNEAERLAIQTLAANPLPVLDTVNTPYVKNIMKRYFSREQLREMSKAKRKPHVHAIMVAMTIRNRIMLQPELLDPLDCRQIVASYQSKYHPELFQNLEDAEVLYLAQHMVAVNEMMKVIPPRQNQGLYLAVGALLEESNFIYRTGGDPARSTRRRQDIFQTLTGIVPGTRAPQAQGGGADEDDEEDNNNEDGEAEESTTTQKFPSPTHYQQQQQQFPAQGSVPFGVVNPNTASYSVPVAPVAPPAIAAPATVQADDGMDVEETGLDLVSFNTSALFDIVANMPVGPLERNPSYSSSSFASPNAPFPTPVSPAVIHIQPASFHLPSPPHPLQSYHSFQHSPLPPQQSQPIPFQYPAHFTTTQPQPLSTPALGPVEQEDNEDDTRLVTFNTTEMIRILDRGISEADGAVFGR